MEQEWFPFARRGLGLLAGIMALSSPASSGSIAAQARESANTSLKRVSPAACMPLPTDYTFLWWAHGWRGRSPEGAKLLCIQTGRYGLAIDAEKARITNLGIIPRPKTYEEAARQENRVVLDLPTAALHLGVMVGSTQYRCVRAVPNGRETIESPVRIIESGRFVQRADMQRLEFEDGQGRRLDARGRLEMEAWPDRLILTLEVTPDRDLVNSEPRIGLESRQMSSQGAPAEREDGTWKAGQARSVTLSLSPAPGAHANPAVSDAPAGLVARAEKTDGERTPAQVVYDRARQVHVIGLPREDWSVKDSPDHLERLRLTLSNPSANPQTARLVFAKDYDFTGITGMTPMLRDAEGNPTGIPVQTSKNWHRDSKRRLLYEGPWFHGSTLVRLPARSSLSCEFDIAYARWGGVPAASHAQLCLIGWGVNQLWEQAAIGSWGEAICYDPDVNLTRSMIDDVRPLMVWAMKSDHGKWDWTNNVGGGDFLVYFDGAGRKQFLSRMKTAYRSYGPNLTDVVYSGVTEDDAIAARIEVSTPRSDDFNRAFHRLRYDVLKPVSFRRLAFYQLGADRYNDHQFERLAYGNAAGLAKEWSVEKGGRRYHRIGIPCTGDAPWFSLHRSISAATQGGAWANRGLIIRSWKARLGGQNVPTPFASSYGTEDKVASANIELSPPPGLTTLKPGDFVEAEVELVVLPMSAEDYYGPNEPLRSALAAGGNTWRPLYREAVANSLRVNVERGRLLHHYPIVVRVDRRQSAEIAVGGGAGYVPVTFSGLRNYRGYGLWRMDGGVKTRVDQSVLGNDYWQSDYDPATRSWRRTYNVPLDRPGDRAGTPTRLILEPESESAANGKAR